MHALVVDDDATIREVARLSLELVGGWTVSLAESGAEAIIQARALSPDVILLDLMMPGIDGMATLRELEADPQTNRIPVIFLTATTLTGERQRLEDAGASGLIVKPFDPMNLVSAVEAILSDT